MSELLVCEGCTLKFSDTSVSGDITVNPAVGTPPSVLSQKVAVEGNKVFLVVGFLVTNFSGLGISNGTGAGIIIGTSQKAKAGTLSIVLETDSTVVVVTGTNDSPPPPVLAVSVGVEIDDPGQDKVRVE